MRDNISIKGARVNNLRNVDLDIPRNKLVVFTGLSGSGKTSLAFDTLYAEGQRRYVESLSSYARQFLGQMEKPDVDYIDGLSPAISIDQKTTGRNPRSTVGTVTEIHDYLRLLYARIGIPHCPKCGRRIEQQTIDQMVDKVMALPEGTRIQIMAPVIRGRKGEYAKLLEDMRTSGYVRVRIDGQMFELSDEIILDKKKKHSIEIVVDRIILRPDAASRVADSLENALELADGLALVGVIDGEEMLFSQNYSCVECGISIEELEPRSFSFNSPFGACPACTGLGMQSKISPELIIAHPERSLAEGAIKISGWSSVADDSMSLMAYRGLAEHYGFDITTTVCELPEEFMNILMYGSGEEKIQFSIKTGRHERKYEQPFEGIVRSLERRFRETGSEMVKQEIGQYMVMEPCPVCRGLRLKPEVLAVTVGDLNIAQLSLLSVKEARVFIDNLKLSPKESMSAERI